ncbi:protein FAM184A [Lingula anatina]|uniref:Protein FAM184A n=1 Tax=Lingula anatina TaxID=7574 RepID=A0A1S3K2K0_LINAN|nr:protein FAM184A [Lingula anatina]XP_013416490.1 protein FAM184A [Lingula anatina]XP_013416491.1 protein FAM184A [Lingula anatina]|eukprot:XP_013416489.1 protein FAM184A [Lingula anatina]
MADAKARKTFEFRMSKKVAELTQVVHMLFTRNHEREVEIEALKDAYEHEISLLIKDAKSRIEAEENKVKEMEQKGAAEGEKFKSLLEIEMRQRETELQKRIEQKDKQLSEEKRECQSLRDMLINAQKDIENLRQGVTDDLNSKKDELILKEREIENLKRTVGNMERKMKEKERETEDIVAELEETNSKLLKEIERLRELLEESSESKEALTIRNKQLESDYRNLKKELAKKFSEMANKGAANNTDFDPKRSTKSLNYMEYHDELERLRREVQRYKMELTNREGNFNRMFTDKQNVRVDGRAGRFSMQQQQFFQSAVPATVPPFKVIRERTIACAVSEGYDASQDEFQVNSSRCASATSSGRRLPPMLGMDARSRLSRFIRPKPPAKAMLSGK